MKNFIGKYYWVSITLFLLSTACTSVSDNKLWMPHVFSDNMVLQRNQEINVWGTCKPGEAVTITFHSDTFSIVADKSGAWKTTLNKYEAGGPFEMSVFTASDTLSFNNILLGDVWLASGQSNMSMSFAWGGERMKRIYDSISPYANNSNIRLLQVQRDVSRMPEKDILEALWVECDSASIFRFSAVAYYFAQELNSNVNVPIGIIHSSWGGTKAEAWTGYNALKTIPELKDTTIKFESSNLDLRELRKKDNIAGKVRDSLIKKVNDGVKQGVTNLEYNDETWKTFSELKNWKGTDVEKHTGYVWLRKIITIPENKVDENYELSLGRIWYKDLTYINDSLIGDTRDAHIFRTYTIPSGILKAGENILAIRVLVPWAIGGFNNPELAYLSSKDSDFKMSLLNDWKYSNEVEPQFPPVYGVNGYYAALYNAMIAPLIPFNIKGIIWYQGEANAGRAYAYRTLLPALINGWRTDWDNLELPFLVVQLANFGEQSNTPAESEWAELREAQLFTAENDPNVGLAVTVDIGEKNDIHPINKKDVGKRLGLSALKIAYGEDVLSSGPIYKDMKVEGNKAIISFEYIGSGLVIRPLQEINGFAIAGEDSVFHWAKVSVSGDKLVAYSDEVKKPIAVRYAWDNAPYVSLFNKEGLPASPFRTDDWKGITVK